MTETIETKVEIDERIRQQPELLQAVTEAMAYLDKQIEIVPPPVAISWQLRQLDPKSVELSMRDSGEPELKGSRIFPLRDLFDPISRDIWVLRVWRELLHARSQKNRAQFDKKFNAIDWDRYTREYDEILKNEHNTNEQ